LSGVTVFARRSIQHFLTELQSVLTPPQAAAVVDRLNQGDLDSLAVEWEVCVLFALMNLGRVTYEPAFAGRSCPDIHFVTNDNDEHLQFVADVTLISDSHLEEKNPITALTQIVAAKARKLGIPGAFSFGVGHTSMGRYGAHRIQLSIPHKQHLQGFITKHIIPQLRVIAKSPSRPAIINIVDAGWNLNISYAPGERFSFGNYRAFRIPTIKDRNPLYNALEDKRKQLRDTEYRGCKGIIVCDGGCEAITQQLTDYDSYSKKQILAEFFRRNTSVSFVILIWIEVEHEPGAARRLRVCGQIDTNPRATEPLPEPLVDLLRQLPQFWPEPVQTGENARLQLEGYGPKNIPPWWGRRVGGYKMGLGPNQITYRMRACRQHPRSATRHRN
jgi:hypothetical protein